MADSEDVKEIEVDEDLEEKSPQEIKRKIKVVEKELDKVSNVEWVYSKRLMKFGIATWIFGIAAFFAAVMIIGGPDLLINSPPISKALIIGAGVGPILVTALFARRYRWKIRRLKRLREDLLSEYEKALLKKVEENIA